MSSSQRRGKKVTGREISGGASSSPTARRSGKERKGARSEQREGGKMKKIGKRVKNRESSGQIRLSYNA